MFWILIQILPLLGLLYFYLYRKYSYWSDRGVVGPRAIFPFGYLLGKAFHQPHHFEQSYYRKYGKVYGVYTGTLPTLTVADPELIKQVLVKDFPHFVNRRIIYAEHPIWNKNLFFLEGDEWKRVRSITSPAFTSGKLKSMYPLMRQCIDKLVAYMDSRITGDGVLYTKEVLAGFTIDVIASTSFATATNANAGRAKENPFVYHGLNIFKFSPLKVAAIMTFPRSLLNALGFHVFFPEDSFSFFTKLTTEIVQKRKSKLSTESIKGGDLVQLMIDAKAMEAETYDKLTVSMENDDDEETTAPESSSKSKKALDESEIVAQCILFFLAGFETTAATLTHAVYEMSLNPEIQDRLVEEMSAATEGIDESNLPAYYDTLLNRLPYLDAIVKETLRKYPPVVRLERRVSGKNIKLGGIPLDDGVLIEIPTYTVHHDPDNYPEPSRFNPERFLPESKHLLVPYTYIPFGDGPRNCLGMRFAYQEAKLCLAAIVQRYHFSRTAKTPEKLTFMKGSPMMASLPFTVQIASR